MLRIECFNLHWLVDDLPSEDDLCAHAGVRVEYMGIPVLVSEEDDLAVSTGALHLLRALESNHTEEEPLVEHLVPHCGHFMYPNEATGELVNMGCSSGLNWWVRHRGDTVSLAFPCGREIRVRREQWRDAIIYFSDAVAAFYDRSPAKKPEPELDEPWFWTFREEWYRRHTAATADV